MKNDIKKSKAPEPVGKYPYTRKVGNLIFLSGIGPRKPNTNIIPGVMMDGQGNPLGHDIEIQCHSVFKNVKIILEEAGSSWNNLVDVTVFLTNIKRNPVKTGSIIEMMFNPTLRSENGQNKTVP